MGIKIPWSWQNKPPRGVKIDRSHPMAKDLVFFVALHHGVGNQQDLISGRIGSFTNTTDGSDPIYNQREGIWVPGDMTAQTGKRGWDFGDMPGDHSDPWEIEYGCIMARARPITIDGSTFHAAQSRIMSYSNSVDGTDCWSLNADDNGVLNNQMVLRMRDDPPTGSEVAITRASGDYVGVLMDLAGDCAPGGNNLDFYLWEVENNIFQSSTGNVSPEPMGASGEQVTIGYRGPDNDRAYAGSIEYCALFNRPKGFAFINAFRQNPWQIFEPFELDADTGVVVDDVANSGETPGSGSESWVDGSAGNVITGLGFYDG